MSKNGTQVLEAALSLPPLERAEVVDQLLASLDPGHDREVEQLWGQEVEERLAAFDRGEIKTVPAREALRASRKAQP